MKNFLEKSSSDESIKLRVGDKIKIVKDRLNGKVLANVEINEIVTITGFSDDGKIMYHNNSLALPVYSNIYVKINPEL